LRDFQVLDFVVAGGADQIDEWSLH